MKKQIGRFALWVFRWKSETTDYKIITRSVMIAAPHTSNWDLIFMVAIFWKHQVNVKFFIKDAYTKGIHGFFFRWLGGIGIDRSKPNNMVEVASGLFKKTDRLIIIIPPEGTRKRVPKWKKGFYFIAKQAQVPISLGYLDYEKKIGGVGGFLSVSDSFNEDMKNIQHFYRTKTAKFPEMYNPEIY